MLNLKSLKVKGFRGFIKEQEFDFENPAVFLFGGNRSGKSSTLNAIEWCLFGNQCIGSETGIRERINFEIPNRNMKPLNASVELTLEDKDSNVTYKVFRKWISSKKYDLTLSLPDGISLTGQDAEEKLAQSIKSTFRDFLTTVHQHQEAIRAVLTQEPGERNDAIDRLLGLSVYRNLLTGIDKAKLKSELRDMGKDFDSFKEQVEIALKTREKDLNDKKADAINNGVKENELNERGALKISKEVLNQLEKFSQETRIELQKLQLPNKSDELLEFLKNAKGEIKRFRSEMPDVKEQEKLFERQTKLAKIKKDYQNEKSSFDSVSKELKNFSKKHGDGKTISKKKGELENELKAKQNELSKANARAAAVKDSINYLKLVGVDKDVCPVCNKRTENLLDHLKKEWEKKYEKQVGEIQKQMEELQNQISEVEKTQKELKRLNEDIKGAKEDLDKVIKEVSETLNKVIKKSEDPSALLQKDLDNSDRKIKSLEKAVKSKHDTLDNIVISLENVHLILDILKGEEKKKIVEQIQSSAEYKRIDELQGQMALLADDVENIKEAISGASHKEAKHKVNAAGKIIDDYFRRITNSPVVKKLEFSVDVDSRNRNSYKFTDENKNSLTPILNQGDLNALALAIFLGMLHEKSISSSFGFAMMDDPSQSMDSNYKESFVEVLNDILDEKMLILSTMDKELQDLLIKNITKAKTNYIFKDWSPKDGPQISEA